MKKNKLVLPQNTPLKNSSEPLWKKVIADMNDRDSFGFNKYGTRLQAFNGRNSSIDAYQEVLDLAVYLKQMIEEREEMVKVLKNYAIDNVIYSKKYSDAGFDAYDLLKKLGEIE